MLDLEEMIYLYHADIDDTFEQFHPALLGMVIVLLENIRTYYKSKL